MVAKRMQKVAPSATGVMAAKIDDMLAEGMDILKFNLGEPDFDTPDKIVKAGQQAIADGYTRYASVSGIAPLKREIAAKLQRENGLTYDISQICVSTGAKQSVFNAVLAVCDEGDEVLIPTPCWVSYEDMVRLANATPVLIPPGKDFSLNLEAIEAAITEHTRMVIINTPNNPTGAVYSRESLQALGELAVKHNFYILSDEVYEKLVFDREHVSVGSLSPEIYDHTITINGFSKAFAMTGWRLGYVAGPKDVIKAVIALQSNCTTSAVTFVQYAAITALRECAEDVEIMRQEFVRRRDYTYERINRIPGISCTRPEGAFYVMPDITGFFGKKYKGKVLQNSFDFCDFLLDEAKIAVVPGDAFEYPGTIRFAYPTSMEIIKEGLDRMEKALQILE